MKEELQLCISVRVSVIPLLHPRDQIWLPNSIKSHFGNFTCCSHGFTKLTLKLYTLFYAIEWNTDCLEGEINKTRNTRSNVWTLTAEGTELEVNWMFFRSLLTVSGSFILIFGRVWAVSSGRAGAHAENVPGCWFQTGDDDAGSSGARWRVAQLLVFLFGGTRTQRFWWWRTIMQVESEFMRWGKFTFS